MPPLLGVMQLLVCVFVVTISIILLCFFVFFAKHTKIGHIHRCVYKTTTLMRILFMPVAAAAIIESTIHPHRLHRDECPPNPILCAATGEEQQFNNVFAFSLSAKLKHIIRISTPTENIPTILTVYSFLYGF